MLKIIINRKLISVISIFAFIAVIIFFLSVRAPKGNIQNGRIQVVTSFYPLAYVTRAVGGNLVNVHNLVPAGVEPHDFEPTSRDLIEIGNADVLIYNGASLEPWVLKWQEGVAVKPKQVTNMADALVESGTSLIVRNGVADPHFWLDPTIMKSEALIVRDMLTELDPAHKDFFIENTSRLLGSLDALDQHFVAGLSVCASRDVVVLHEAFNYLGRQYKFYVTSISGISPDEEPSPKELARITDAVRKKNIKFIFSETIASPKFSELIAREVGGTTLVLNPIESLTPNEVQLGEDYISTMLMNLNNLKIAMSCN